MSSELIFCIEQSDINESAPLIYRWEVKSLDCIPVYEYVGRAVNGSGRTKKDYKRNVRDLLAGKHWHEDESKDFREVHYVLAGAVVEKHKVHLSFLMNCAAEDINQRERECQERFIVSNAANRAVIDRLIFTAMSARGKARAVP